MFQFGQEKIVVHELKFKGKVQVEKEYLFKGCGDEDLNLGKRDLRLKIQTVSSPFGIMGRWSVLIRI